MFANKSGIRIGKMPRRFPERLVSKVEAVNTFVLGWERYCELAELLELSLADITIRIEGRAYYTSFTTQELTRMIRGLFADSEKRARVLELIATR